MHSSALEEVAIRSNEKYLQTLERWNTRKNWNCLYFIIDANKNPKLFPEMQAG